MTKQPMCKALVVDDNSRWLRTLARLVIEAGYIVLTAQTYAEALRKAQNDQGTLDLVVTDIRLIDNEELNIDGLRLLIALYDEPWPLKGSIVVTGYPSSETREIAKRLGAVYLEKGSFAREDFLRALSRIIRES